jgi:hypothetical protein
VSASELAEASGMGGTAAPGDRKRALSDQGHHVCRRVRADQRGHRTSAEGIPMAKRYCYSCGERQPSLHMGSVHIENSHLAGFAAR